MSETGSESGPENQSGNASETVSQAIAKRPLMAVLSGLVAVLLGYLLLWPVPFDPQAGPMRAANPAGTGVFAKNNKLASAKMLASGIGPEAVALDERDKVYSGLTNGDIVRFTRSGKQLVLANTGGRPLGIKFDIDGNLIIADAKKGLLSLAANGAITELATHHDGVRMKFVDDLDIAADGKIYFSDASARYEYGHDIMEVFERRPSGRLMVYDPATKQLDVLLDNLYFANGVALSAAQDFVLVNETFEHRVMRYWLRGPKAGTAEVFVDNMPAYLDNITRAPDGGFWLAGVAARTDALDALVARPFLRKVVWRLMQITGSSPAEMHSYAIKLSANGEVVHSLEDDSGHIFMMTSVIEHKGRLYLGSLINDGIGVIDAP